MNNSYFRQFIQQFIQFIVPKGKTSLLISKYNRNLPRTKGKRYDYIILFDIFEEEKDILSLLNRLYQLLEGNGRLVIIYKNYLHSFFVGLYQSITKSGHTNANWLSTTDIQTFLKLTNFDFLLSQPLSLTSGRISFLGEFLNRFLLYLYPFNHLSFLHYIIAIKKPLPIKEASVSIIIPARNEEGNIKQLFQKIPKVGKKCEIIFVEDHSTDNTRGEIGKYLKIKHPVKGMSYKYFILEDGRGKSDAVRLGVRKANNDILMIYDADMTVDAADLLKFYQAMISRKGDFINGSRLIYPIEKNAMQFLNILGNKFFSILYSWLLGQEIKDTLCGSKTFWRQDYLAMEKNALVTEKQDPFGDFYLLLTASRLNLKIIDLPVRYYDREYGSTNIKRFRNGWQLLKFSFIAIKKLKMRLI